MANRAIDWLNQAQGDLRQRKNARTAGDYDWGCFAGQQAAEKAVNGLILSKGGEGWGHSVMRLLKDLFGIMEIPERLIRSGGSLFAPSGIKLL